MSTTWILIANSSQANLYKAHKAKLFKTNGHDEENLILLKSFKHADSRKKTGDLIADRSGNFSGGGGHGSFVEASMPKELEAEKFARELVQILEDGRKQGDYDDLIIIANPPFKGMLNKLMHEPLDRLISQSIEKDYTHMKGRALVQQLRQFL